MCDHRLDDSPTGLVCQLDAHPEHPTAHVYAASAGADLGGGHS